MPGTDAGVNPAWVQGLYAGVAATVELRVRKGCKPPVNAAVLLSVHRQTAQPVQ